MTSGRGRGSGSGRRAAIDAGPIPGFDLYRVIGVRPDATQQEVSEAIDAMEGRLRTAAARDRGGATARQKRLNVARHWLGDPARRRAYDAGVARGEGGSVVGAPPGRVRAGRVGAGAATRRSAGASSGSILSRPLTWVGVAAVALIVGFLVLRPGGFGLGSGTGGPSTNPSASSSVTGGVQLPSGSADAGIPASCPKSQPAAAPAGQSQVATIATEKGSIEITLVDDLSPIAVGNFVALASCGYYDSVVFHRVVPNFVIQGGDGQFGRASTYASGRAGTGGPGYTIQDEPVKTLYSRGTVAMARTAQANSVGSQFFIVLSDEARTALASANTYQIIGSVTKGMDVADAIAAAADAENPSQPVAMTSVKVAPPTPYSPPPSGSPAPSAAASAAPSAS